MNCADPQRSSPRPRRSWPNFSSADDLPQSDAKGDVRSGAHAHIDTNAGPLPELVQRGLPRRGLPREVDDRKWGRRSARPWCRLGHEVGRGRVEPEYRRHKARWARERWGVTEPRCDGHGGWGVAKHPGPTRMPRALSLRPDCPISAQGSSGPSLVKTKAGVKERQARTRGNTRRNPGSGRWAPNSAG